MLLIQKCFTYNSQYCSHPFIFNFLSTHMKGKKKLYSNKPLIIVTRVLNTISEVMEINKNLIKALEIISEKFIANEVSILNIIPTSLEYNANFFRDQLRKILTSDTLHSLWSKVIQKIFSNHHRNFQEFSTSFKIDFLKQYQHGSCS